jgi:putative PIG3 family NAD(P)H quinone oxidoreductase
MRAIVISQPGPPEVLQLRDVPSPPLGRGEVRVRVRATAVNRADLLQRMGRYPAPPDAPPDIPGLEFAGEVIELGEGAAADPGAPRVGDRVFGLVGGGAYAEEVVVPARALARIPDGMSFTDAAAVPEAFITAWDAMVTQGRLESGEALLIHAVGSGVGTAAVQLGRVRGARVVGTARSPEKLARAKALGLDEGIVPEGGRFAGAVRAATGGRGADVVLELVGGGYVGEDLSAAAERGRIVVVGLTAGARAELDLALLLGRRLSVVGTVLRARPLEEKIAVMRTFERHVVPLFAAGKLAPVIETVMALDEAPRAHALVASNATFGKVVLSV